LIACDDFDLASVREHKNTLGHLVERLKSRLAVRIRHLFERRYSTDKPNPENFPFEGGEKDVVIDAGIKF
jgi:hypothetical protein